MRKVSASKRFMMLTACLGILICTNGAPQAQGLNSLSCDELWFERNKIYFFEGFCFKSTAGQSVFGTDCHPPYGRLTDGEERSLQSIQAMERVGRCPSAPSLYAVLSSLRDKLNNPAGGKPTQTVVVVTPAANDVTGSLINAAAALELSRQIGILNSQISALAEVLNEQRQEKKSALSEASTTLDETISLIEQRMARYQTELSTKEKAVGPYLTSIRPNDRDPYISARKVSEIYPRVPFYIPGTNETGEFWVEPIVSDAGELRFSFKFIDKDSSVDKVRSQIDLNLQRLDEVTIALLKVAQWSKKAHDEKNYAEF